MLNKRDFSILIGNTLDHYDTALYGFLVPILAPIFFSVQDSIITLILGYGVLATSFMSGPIGAYIFSKLAKYYNPNLSLAYSLIGLAISTAIIGLLPTYNQIGLLSPILLIMTRIIQAVFAAGENAIARIYILEDKTKEQAFKISYYYEFSTMLGIILASGISTIIFLLPREESYWRICFLIGGCTGFIGYAIRRYDLDSTCSLKNIQSTFKADSCYFFNINYKVFKRNYKTILLIALTNMFGYMTYYIAAILLNGLVPLVTNIKIETMMKLNTGLLILNIILVPIIGYLTKNYNYRNTLLNSLLLFAVVIIPLIYYLKGANLWYIILTEIFIIIIGIIYSCLCNLWVNDLAIDQDKYFIIGFARALGAGVLGKSVPAFSLSVWYFTNSLLSIGIYFAVISLITWKIISI